MLNFSAHKPFSSSSSSFLNRANTSENWIFPSMSSSSFSAPLTRNIRWAYERRIYTHIKRVHTEIHLSVLNSSHTIMPGSGKMIWTSFQYRGNTCFLIFRLYSLDWHVSTIIGHGISYFPIRLSNSFGMEFPKKYTGNEWLISVRLLLLHMYILSAFRATRYVQFAESRRANRPLACQCLVQSTWHYSACNSRRRHHHHSTFHRNCCCKYSGKKDCFDVESFFSRSLRTRLQLDINIGRLFAHMRLFTSSFPRKFTVHMCIFVKFILLLFSVTVACVTFPAYSMSFFA